MTWADSVNYMHGFCPCDSVDNSAAADYLSVPPRTRGHAALSSAIETTGKFRIPSAFTNLLGSMPGRGAENPTP